MCSGIHALAISSKATAEEKESAKNTTCGKHFYAIIHDLAELLVNEDRSAHQYAIWILLEETCRLEGIHNGVDVTRLIQKTYNSQREEIKSNPKSDLRLNFPFVAESWGASNSTKAEILKTFIISKSKMIGVGRMAVLLLMRALQC